MRAWTTALLFGFLLAASAAHAGSQDGALPPSTAESVRAVEAARVANSQRAMSAIARDPARGVLRTMDVGDAPTAPLLAQLEKASPPQVQAPRTPAGEQLEWFLQTINARKGALSPQDAAQHFSKPFLQQVPPAQLAATFKQLSDALAPLRLTSVTEKSPLKLLAQVATRQGPARVSLAVSADASHTFDGLLVQPGAVVAPPTSWDALEASLAASGARTGLLAARLDSGKCVPVRAVRSSEELAIGSTFKLYVLLAVAAKVDAGTLSLNTPITVRDAWKSWPSGTLQSEPAGTQLPLRQVAQQMIAISDNTAADHLLHTVGREAVERALKRTHHAHPSLDLPFLTTRELFTLKLGVPPEAQARYAQMDEKARRVYLAQLDGQPLPPLSAAGKWKAPIAIDTLEWFASPEDLCHAMQALREEGKSQPGSPVLAVLAKNPGVTVDRSVWSYVGYKGGSEPGVMNLTFLLQRKADGAWFVLSLGANDPKHDIDQGKFVSLAEGALHLLSH